jgi:hypothetical protein
VASEPNAKERERPLYHKPLHHAGGTGGGLSARHVCKNPTPADPKPTTTTTTTTNNKKRRDEKYGHYYIIKSNLSVLGLA